MKIIYTHNGSNLCVDLNSLIVPNFIVYGNVKFKVVSTTINLDLVEEQIYAEVVRYGAKTVRCVKVWEQSKDNLTEGKLYQVVRETEKDFTIVTDQGKERKYKHDNFQFEVV